MKTKKLTQTKTYTTNGIGINVRINFENNHISIVDDNGKDKDFRFANRGVEFMQGWLDILDATKAAIKEAKVEYEAELAEQSRLKEEKTVELIKAIAKSEIEHHPTCSCKSCGKIPPLIKKSKNK